MTLGIVEHEQSGPKIDLRVEQVFAGIQHTVILKPPVIGPTIRLAPEAIDLHESTATGVGIGFIPAVDVAPGLAVDDV